MAEARPLLPAGAYWGTIQAAAESRIGYVRALQAVQVAAGLEAGQAVRFSRGDFQSFYTQAIRNREAATLLNAAPGSIALGPEHIGAIPNAPAGPLGNVPRRYIVQFEHKILRAGEQVSQWRTDVFAYGLPGTKSALVNRLHRDAAILAGEYPDETHLGIGDIRLLAA